MNEGDDNVSVCRKAYLFDHQVFIYCFVRRERRSGPTIKGIQVTILDS